MLDDLRTYLQMATGMTEATTAKAKEVVSGLLSTGLSLSSKAVPAPEMMGQVQELADDLVATSKNNRDMLTAMIRAEVDKAVGRMGFVREDELAALRRHVQRLERQVADLEQQAASAPAPSPAPWPTPDPAEPDAQDAPADVVGEAQGLDALLARSRHLDHGKLAGERIALHREIGHRMHRNHAVELVLDLLDHRRCAAGHDGDARDVLFMLRLGDGERLDVVAAAREQADDAGEHAGLVVDDDGEGVGLDQRLGGVEEIGRARGLKLSVHVFFSVP